MSEQQPGTEGQIPEWDRADRMRKALRSARMTPGEMAAYLQVGGNTVSTWINGRVDPSPQTLRLWALRTGVPFRWLCHNTMESCDLRPQVSGSNDVSAASHGHRINNMHSFLFGLAS